MKKSDLKEVVIAANNVFLEDELQSAANKIGRPIDRVKAAMGESNGVLLLCLSDKEVAEFIDWGLKGKNMMVSLKPGKARLSGTQITTDVIPILTKRGKKVG